MTKQSFSCDCGNVMDCIAEDDVIKPKYKSISGNVRIRCNDCGKEHQVFLKYKIAKFIGASPSFKEISYN
jgi:transposase-like protein